MCKLIAHTLTTQPSLGAYPVSSLHYLAVNNFCLPIDVRKYFKTYVLRKWRTYYVLSGLREGCLEFNGTSYIVVFKNKKSDLMGECLVTFREPSDALKALGVPSYCLVKAA